MFNLIIADGMLRLSKNVETRAQRGKAVKGKGRTGSARRGQSVMSYSLTPPPLDPVPDEPVEEEDIRRQPVLDLHSSSREPSPNPPPPQPPHPSHPSPTSQLTQSESPPSSPSNPNSAPPISDEPEPASHSPSPSLTKPSTEGVDEATASPSSLPHEPQVPTASGSSTEPESLEPPPHIPEPSLDEPECSVPAGADGGDEILRSPEDPETPIQEPAMEELEGECTQSSAGEDFDDFAEFADFSSSQPQQPSQETEDGWAKEFESKDEDDWAADMKWATSEETQTPQPPPSPPSQPVERGPDLSQLLSADALKFSDIFSCSGAESEESDGDGVEQLQRLIKEKEPWPQSQPVPPSANIERRSEAEFEYLWSLVRCVEEARALSFLWGNGARGYAAWLSALGVSQEAAALRIPVGDPSRPAFARHLNVLPSIDPTPLKPQPIHPPQDALKVERGEEGKVEKNEEEANGEIPASLAVPPAEFNWQESGLHNPLIGSQRKAPLLPADLDMSFLERKPETMEGETGTGGAKETERRTQPNQALASDLANMGLQAAPINTPSQPAKKEVASLSVAGLTAEAAALARTLPDLAFLTRDYLSFPLNAQPD